MKNEINKELLPMKAHYFLFNAGTAPVVPFMPTLARQLGYSSVVVGTIYTVLPIVGMLAKPIFGLIADRYQQYRNIFLAGQMVTAIAFFMIMFIPAIPQPLPNVQFHCHSNFSDIRYCAEYDKCIVNNLEQYFTDQSELLKCELNCDANPYLKDVICNNWLNTTNCMTENNSYFDLTVYLNMSNILIFKECLYFLIPHNHGQIQGQNVSLFCPNNKHYFNATCTMECQDAYFMDQISVSPVITTKNAMNLYQFWLFFAMLIISWMGMAIVVSIGDTICFSILGERHHLYGKQRLYGSVGFGLFAILSGVLVDKLSGETVHKNYTIIFWMTLVLIGCDVLTSTKLKPRQTYVSTNILKDVKTMFRSLRCIIFFLFCIFIGLCTALIWNFLFWYLEELGGCSSSMKTLEGIAMGIQCFGGELPFFFISGWILKKIGHVNAMSLVLFSFGIRFILYSLLTNPWYVLPIELLNGVTFGIFYATMASYANIVAPPGTEATMQGLVGAIFEGVGVSTGSFIAGLLFETLNGSATFAIFGIAALIAFVAHVLIQLYMKKIDYGRDSANDSVRYLPPNDAMHMLNEQESSIVS